MQLEIAELKGKSLMLCTPAYNSQISAQYMLSVINLSSLCQSYGVPLQISIVHDSLVTRARNRQADIFLSSNCTHQLLIDSDISFNASDVLQMLSIDKEFSAAPYPKKQINWERVKTAVLNNSDIDPKALESIGGDFVLNLAAKPLEGKTWVNLAEPNKILEAGTGFMLIRRSVYEKMIPTTSSYIPVQGEESFSGPEIYDFFPAEIDRETRIYLSEDYSFCRRWKALDGDLWLCPWIKLTHHGQFSFKGDLMKIAESGLQM